ncbi:MAG: chromate transporter [Tenericutes bacterium]|jgi:chromate transporter|nr:chromate transporter [Mycoplasmatota bacterium]
MLIKLLELFVTFFKIGVFTFGGGYAMIPLITDEVIAKGWQTKDTLIDFIAIAESTPGPFAINISTFIGYEQQGIIGAMFATLGVIVPSFVIIIIIAKVFNKFADNKYVIGFLNGAKPIIVGVIFSVGIDFLLSSVFKIKEITLIREMIFDWKTIVIFLIVFGLTKVKERMHPIFIVVLSGLLGYILFGII